MGWWKTIADWLSQRKGPQQGLLRAPEPPGSSVPAVPQVPQYHTEPSSSPDVLAGEPLGPPDSSDVDTSEIAPHRRTPVVRPERSGPRAITVGLDFGTHSTKILFRPRGDDKAVLLPVRKSHDGYPWFASPSLVRLADGRVYFGGKALEVKTGKLFRSLKVQLLPPTNTNECIQEYPSGLTPDLLVAFYLSWTLKRIKAAIDRYWRHGQPKVFLNMAAPMNHVENESLKTRYLQIVQAAWESVVSGQPFPAQQGIKIDELRPRFKAWIEKEVPSKEVRPFDVLPETVAPIVSLSFDPRMDPGMYMIVDMGAGTTELSVTHVEEPSADQRVLCYHDESVASGADTFAWLDKTYAGYSEHRERVGKLVAYFMHVFHRTWGTGYQKDSRNPTTRARWRCITTMLTGGGAHRPEIQQAIQTALPMTSWPVGESRYHVKWHEPTGVYAGNAENGQGSGQTSLLAVAHGLSVPRQQWPVVFHPGEIESQEAPVLPEKLPAYWYVD